MLSAEVFTGICGILLSAAFRVVPPLQKWYDGFGEWKGLAMAAFTVIVAFLLFGANCLGFLGNLTCDVAGVKSLVEVWVIVFLANQGTYLATPKGKSY